MSIKEDILDVENKMKKLENESLAMELLRDYKKTNSTNSRMFIIILVILLLWFATIGAFVYYISTTGFEEDYREQTIEDLKDTDNFSIINGDSYGIDKTNKKNKKEN